MGNGNAKFLIYTLALLCFLFCVEAKADIMDAEKMEALLGKMDPPPDNFWSNSPYFEQEESRLSSNVQYSTSPAASDFFPELLRNFGRLFSKENIAPVLACTTACLGSSALDDDVKAYFSPKRKSRIIGDGMSFLGSSVFIGGLSAGLMIHAYHHDNHRMRRMTFSLVQGVLVTEVVTQVIKISVNRERPDGKPYSFPSGHASVSFMAATVVGHYGGKHASIIAYTVASAIAVSRLEKNRHYLSDIVAGAFVGYICGSSIVRGTDAISSERRFSWSPTLAPGGIGISFSFRL